MKTQWTFALASLVALASCSGAGQTAQSALPRNPSVSSRTPGLKHAALPPAAFPIIYIRGTGGNHLQSYSYGSTLLTDLTNVHAQAESDIAVDPSTANLYALGTSGSTSVAYIWSYGATGTTAPSASLNIPQSSGHITIDASGYIWVSSGSSPCTGELDRYSPGSTGSTSPIQTINNSHICLVRDIATDSSGNIYASAGTGSQNQIVEYSATANGNATPLKVIGGSNTDLGGGPTGVAVDSNGRIVAADYANNRILIWNASDSGNVAPDVIISGSNTTLNQPFDVEIGGSNDIYVPKAANDSILVFDSTASGNVAPTHTISTNIAGGWITLCRSSDGCQSHI